MATKTKEPTLTAVDLTLALYKLPPDDQRTINGMCEDLFNTLGLPRSYALELLAAIGLLMIGKETNTDLLR